MSHYNDQHSEVFCAMMDLSQAYDQNNINTLCNKLRRTVPPDQNINIIGYMCGNTFVNTLNGRQPSELWSVGNGTR